MPDDRWFDSEDTRYSVASHAVHETRELSTAEEVLYFFEKPWKFTELYEQWQQSVDEETATP